MSQTFEFDSELLRHINDGRNDEAILMLNSDLAKASKSFTLLHYVAVKGNSVIARELIRLGAEIDCLEQSGKTPLLIATMCRKTEITKVLLEANADIDICDAKGESALQFALNTRYCKPTITRAFLDRILTKASSEDEFFERLLKLGFTLHDAVRIEVIELLKDLLQRGLNIESIQNGGETALHIAANYNNLEMVKLLTENGANVNALDDANRGPLYNASKRRNAAMMQYLLEKGAQPNIRTSSFEYTPLYILYDTRVSTTEENFDCCVATLLQHGAIPQNEISQSPTIFDFALNRTRSKGIDCLIAHLEMLQMMGTQNAKPLLDYDEVKKDSNNIKLKKISKRCREILQIKVINTVSLIELLTGSDYKMRICARNETFSSKVVDFCTEHDLKNEHFYYFDTLTKRITKAKRIVNLENKAMTVISKILKRSHNLCYVITREIIGYLNEPDLEQLCQV